MNRRQHQRGASLIEALIAFLVLSLGMLGMARLQHQLHLHTDIARQRSEAVRLAQEDMERLRAFAAISAAGGLRSFADVAPAATTVDTTSGYHSNTSYRVERGVVAADGAALKTAAVSVSWPDRSGERQRVLLQSAIAGTSPALSGALALQAGGQPLKTLHGRSARIPLQARNLGDGRSVLKPIGSALAFVFSNTTGLITAQCSHLAANIRPHAITAYDLAPCTAVNALLLSGWIGFEAGAAADAPSRHGEPLAFSMAITLAHDGTSNTPACITQTHDRMVAYHCAIVPVNGRWSGRSGMVPQGWTLGTAANEYKVCRFSSDQDGSGAVDRNAEHPDSYQQVDVPLMQQNFLVIRGDRPCPAELSAVQHQP